MIRAQTGTSQNHRSVSFLLLIAASRRNQIELKSSNHQSQSRAAIENALPSLTPSNPQTTPPTFSRLLGIAILHHLSLSTTRSSPSPSQLPVVSFCFLAARISRLDRLRLGSPFQLQPLDIGIDESQFLDSFSSPPSLYDRIRPSVSISHPCSLHQLQACPTPLLGSSVFVC